MRLRFVTRLALFALLAAPTWAAADQTLASAFNAIVRGDYEAGRSAVAKLLANGADTSTARIQGWLDAYKQVITSRDELRAKTFDWNVAQSKQTLADNKLYLALNFAAQAAPYAADLEEYGNEPWVRELAEKAKAAARDFEGQSKWTKALSFYSLLGFIYKDDEALKALREEAVRHARLALIYKDQAALDERIKGVEPRLLKDAVEQIRLWYYRQPDFRKMAEGGIDNLIDLAQTAKLQSFLDGLANTTLREHFIRKLEELRKHVQTQENFGAKHLLETFEEIGKESAASVELPKGLLVVEFVEGAFGKLDEFTTLIWPADAPDFSKMMEGTFQGVGIQLGTDEKTGTLKVVTPLEDSPALEAGIQPEDLIVEVNGETTKNWTTEDAMKKIMGPAGTDVTLVMRRPSTGELLPYKLVRRKIVLRTVRGFERQAGSADAWNYLCDPQDGIAYIRLTGFHPESQHELERGLEAARQQGMRGLILDLRHNPGGMLDVAIDTVSTFVKSGEVVSTRGRSKDEEQSVNVSGDAEFAEVPLIVLVNEGSASASEILAGALQDHSRALVLGERTFGKGSVQKVLPLRGSARLKLTTALYYLPSGRSPHKALDSKHWGVDPDSALKLTPKEFRKILERERSSYIIHNEGQKPGTPQETVETSKDLEPADEESTPKDDGDEPLLSPDDLKALMADTNAAPDTDPQLETALLLMRVKLAGNLPWPRQVATAAGEGK